MTNLFNPITALLTPDMFAAAGARLGVPGDQLQQGLNLAIPLLTRGVADVASTPEGQVSIAEAVKNADTGVLGNLSSFMTSYSPEGGDAVLRRLFGDEARVVTAVVKDATGIEIAPVLGMTAPLVLGFLNNTVQKEGLDTTALVKMLKSQARSFDRSKSESAVLVDGVLGQVEAVRKLKSNVSPADWHTLRSAPLAAAQLVIEAAPSGTKRQADEIAAAVALVGEEGTRYDTTSLLAALFHGGVAELAATELSNPMATVEAAVALMGRVAPGELAAYKQLVMNAAYAAAQAAKEGGLLRIGAKQVSKEEQAALDGLAAALGAH